MKFCKNCKHFCDQGVKEVMGTDWCYRPELKKVDPVQGYTPSPMSAYYERTSTDENSCGPDAKFYEQEISLLRRLLNIFF
jgi:hypothetical protein